MAQCIPFSPLFHPSGESLRANDEEAKVEGLYYLFCGCILEDLICDWKKIGVIFTIQTSCNGAKCLSAVVLFHT